MRCKIFTTLVLSMLALGLHAQLKIDFGATGNSTLPGYEKYEATDKNAASFTEQSYSAFGGSVGITLSFPAGTLAEDIRVVTRDSTLAPTDSAAVLGDWIGSDSRQQGSGVADSMMITISGLPAGTYKWTSFHHDASDQNSVFDLQVSDAGGDHKLDSLINSVGNLPYSDVSAASTLITSNGSDSIVIILDHLVVESNITTQNSLGFTLINSLILEQVAIDNTWNGVQWSNSAPTGTQLVSLLEDYDFNNTNNFTAKDVMVVKGASLTLSENSTLEISGDLMNAGNVVIGSGSSLLVAPEGSVSGMITVQRNTRYDSGRYSFVGSPFKAIESNMAGNLGGHIYTYNESVDFGADGIARWVSSSSTDLLVPGVGYTQANKQLLSFSGIPNQGDVVINGTYTGSGDNAGFNLVSNPYTAAISTVDFIAGNSNTTGTIYIWDDSASNVERGTNADYITINNVGVVNDSRMKNGSRYDQHIGVGQGFFVKLTDASNVSIAFKESMRVSGNNADSTFFRKGDDKAIVRLSLEGEKVYNETLIGFVDDALETGIKHGFDAQKLSGSSKISFYSLKDNQKMAIQARPSYHNQEINLGFFIEEAGEYKIGLNEIEGIQGVKPLLLDNVSGVTYELSGLSGVTLYLNAGESNDRFSLLLFGEETLLGNEKFVAFYNGSLLNIEFGKELSKETGDVSIYDISGNIVASYSDVSLEDFEVEGSALNFGSLYSIRVITASGEKNGKFMFSN